MPHWRQCDRKIGGALAGALILSLWSVAADATEDGLALCGDFPAAGETRDLPQAYQADIAYRFADRMPLFAEHSSWSVKRGYRKNVWAFADCKAGWKIEAPEDWQVFRVLDKAIRSKEKYTRAQLVELLRVEGFRSKIGVIDPNHCACTVELDDEHILYPNQ